MERSSALAKAGSKYLQDVKHNGLLVVAEGSYHDAGGVAAAEMGLEASNAARHARTVVRAFSSKSFGEMDDSGRGQGVDCALDLATHCANERT